MKYKRTTLLLLALAGTAVFSAAQEDSIPAYKNTSLSFEERARDLEQRMTLEEKISQLGHTSDAVERLGIPEYNWWNEGLHGVARAGVATVFPQAIGLAATFDDALLFQGARAGNLRRRSLPDLAHGIGLRQRDARGRSQVPEDGRDAEAFCRAQRAG